MCFSLGPWALVPSADRVERSTHKGRCIGLQSLNIPATAKFTHLRANILVPISELIFLVSVLSV